MTISISKDVIPKRFVCSHCKKNKFETIKYSQGNKLCDYCWTNRIENYQSKFRGVKNV